MCASASPCWIGRGGAAIARIPCSKPALNSRLPAHVAADYFRGFVHRTGAARLLRRLPGQIRRSGLAVCRRLPAPTGCPASAPVAVPGGGLATPPAPTATELHRRRCAPAWMTGRPEPDSGFACGGLAYGADDEDAGAGCCARARLPAAGQQQRPLSLPPPRERKNANYARRWPGPSPLALGGAIVGRQNSGCCCTRLLSLGQPVLVALGDAGHIGAFLAALCPPKRGWCATTSTNACHPTPTPAPSHFTPSASATRAGGYLAAAVKPTPSCATLPYKPSSSDRRPLAGWNDR